MKQAFSIAEIYDSINRIISEHEEYIEKELAEIIQKYDFIVGSKDTKYRLMQALPKGANIVYSSYIEDPTIVYAVKKISINLFSEPYNEEDRK